MSATADACEETHQETVDSSVSSSAVTPSPSTIAVDASSFVHTPFYCEENVFLLCKKLSAIGVADPMGRDLFAVFISNEAKKVPLWYQKASRAPDGLVVWDYHVICIQSRRSSDSVIDLVWDLDSSLYFPTPLVEYICKAICPLSVGDSTYGRLFRIVHCPILLRSFASNRSHMKDSSGNWMAAPPTYEAIVAEDGSTNNLDQYMTIISANSESLDNLVDAVYSSKYGIVLDEQRLQQFFSSVNRF